MNVQYSENLSKRLATIAFVLLSLASEWWHHNHCCLCWKLDNRNILYTNQDIVYECPLNSMCRCASPPNETRLLEINCNEVSLYKFPGKFLHKIFIYHRCVRLCGAQKNIQHLLNYAIYHLFTIDKI